MSPGAHKVCGWTLTQVTTSETHNKYISFTFRIQRVINNRKSNIEYWMHSVERYSVVDWFPSLPQILVPDFLISLNQEMFLLCVNLAMNSWNSPSVWKRKYSLLSVSVQAFVSIHFQPTFFIPFFSNPQVYIFCFYFLQFYLLFLRFSLICLPL